MSRDIFNKLLVLLLPELWKNSEQALRSSSGAIDPDVSLAVALRFLSGASYLNTMMVFGMSRSVIYDAFHSTLVYTFVNDTSGCASGRRGFPQNVVERVCHVEHTF